MTVLQIATIAMACHGANRVWCILNGDSSQHHWEDAEAWQQESAIRGVEVALAGATPAEQHEAWSADKRREGWVFGTVKDPAKKTHPCLVPYDQLPDFQKRKDAIYIATVLAFAAAIRGDGPPSLSTINGSPFRGQT